MIVLALDTTTRAGSVAVVDGDQVRAVRAGEAARTHGERLPGEIAAVLNMAGVRPADIGLLVVGAGPGAFTGMRIGMAAMQGMAMTLGCPIVGVSALDALAAAACDGRGDEERSAEPVIVAAWMDAQRGEVFSAVYTGPPSDGLPWSRGSAPAVGPPTAALAAQELDAHARVHFVGDGAVRHAALIAQASARWDIAERTPLLAPAMARLGRRGAARGEPSTPHALQPLYVRRPDAEIERDRHRQAQAHPEPPSTS